MTAKRSYETERADVVAFLLDQRDLSQDVGNPAWTRIAGLAGAITKGVHEGAASKRELVIDIRCEGSRLEVAPRGSVMSMKCPECGQTVDILGYDHPLHSGEPGSFMLEEHTKEVPK